MEGEILGLEEDNALEIERGDHLLGVKLDSYVLTVQPSSPRKSMLMTSTVGTALRYGQAEPSRLGRVCLDSLPLDHCSFPLVIAFICITALFVESNEQFPHRTEII